MSRGPIGDDAMQRVQAFRCKICGEPYIGFERPTNCPFCGAHEKYLVALADWRDTHKVKLTGDSRKNLEASLELEKENAEFYLCASRASRNRETGAMFGTLSNVESKHAETISRMLGTERPVIEYRKGACSASSETLLAEADMRENRTVRLYNEFLRRATEPRVRELFMALIEVESDHIDLVNKETSSPEEPAKGEEKTPEEVELDNRSPDFYDSYRIHED